MCTQRMRESFFFSNISLFSLKQMLRHYLRYQILASTSWLPNLGYHILASRSCLPNPACITPKGGPESKTIKHQRVGPTTKTMANATSSHISHAAGLTDFRNHDNERQPLRKILEMASTRTMRRDRYVVVLLVAIH